MREKTRAGLAIAEKSATKSATVSECEMNQAVEEAVATNIAMVREHRQDIKRLRALTK